MEVENKFMKRIAFMLKVKQDKLAEYRAHHMAVWPEMLDALRRTGWHNYSLFLRDDGLLVGYFEAAETTSSCANPYAAGHRASRAKLPYDAPDTQRAYLASPLT